MGRRKRLALHDACRESDDLPITNDNNISVKTIRGRTRGALTNTRFGPGATGSQGPAGATGGVGVMGAAEADDATEATVPQGATGPVGTAYPLNAQTGTTYTLVLGDTGKFITPTNASTVSVTVPTNAAVAFPVGTRIMLLRWV